jgi:hypothetical protein
LRTIDSTTELESEYFYENADDKFRPSSSFFGSKLLSDYITAGWL